MAHDGDADGDARDAGEMVGSPWSDSGIGGCILLGPEHIELYIGSGHVQTYIWHR